MTDFQHWMLSGLNVLTGWRPCCWLDLWNPPSLRMSGLPLYTHHQPLSLRTQSLSFSLLTDLWTLLLSALAQTLMLLCSCRPASFLQVLLLLRALAQTLLPPSSSRPASLSQISLPRLHQGALVQTSLLVSISRPASHTPDPHRQAASSGQKSVRSTSDRPHTDRPSSAGLTGSESPTLLKSSGKDSISSGESDAESSFSDTPPLELFVEEGELSDEHELTEQDLPTSEEQTYRETMRGIRSFMGWSHVPAIDSSNPSDDNPFAGPKAPAPSKISVHMPTEDWLCKKLSKLNLTLVEGYPSRTAETGSLPMDQFLRPPRPQSKWYGLYSEQPADPTKVTSWSTGHSKLNSSFGRIARKAALASTPPASRRISQDTLRRWERTTREASVVCNQAASFNRCLFKVQADMQSQLRTVHSEGKGKGSAKVSEATEELQFLMEFNSSITQAAAKAMEHLSEFVFFTMGNLTLARRDSYLNHLVSRMVSSRTRLLLSGLALCTSVLSSQSQLSNGPKRRSHIMITKASRQLHPHEGRHVFTRMRDRIRNRRVGRTTSRIDPHGKTSTEGSLDDLKARVLTFLHVLPRASNRINDNHCYNRTRLLAGSTSTELTLNSNLNVNLHVVSFVPSAHGPPQKKGLSPGVSDCQLKKDLLNSVKGVSCVSQLSCVNPVTNVPNAAQNLPVGARLQNFWQTWLDLGAGPKIVQILREGYTLPFRIRPHLTRSPTVISRYVDPHRNSYLLEALHQLIDKNAIELVHNQTSLGFFNRLFLVPKPNNKWRPILDLSKLNLFLKVEKFKMETPETIRTSLQQGEWVTSVDFKDAYFHIPIQAQSRKYLRFHVQGRTYQFKALPFDLSTAPMEFTVLVKEVKLMAIRTGIRIHQYLDDWLVRARSQETCLRHTQILVKMCQDLGWLVNLEKSELEPKQVFNFVGYQFDLRSGRVRTTPDRWQSLQDKIQALLVLPACPVRQFMSLIGLLTATEKQVHLGRLHMRPIQWHLKNSWRVPESLEKIIPLPRSLHPHLRWWLEEDNVLQGQPLHPVRHALQIFTDASKEGWGAHLDEFTARGSWLVPETKLHINWKI